MEFLKNNMPVFTFGILAIAFISFTNGKIEKVRTELKADIREVRTELKADIREVRTELKSVNTKLDQLILLQAQGKQAGIK